jgi:hypothetical protein
MITMAAIATLAAVLIPFGEAAAPWAAGVGVGVAAGAVGAFDEFAEAAGVFAIGAPVAGVPHFPQNCTVSFRLAPQFLQNVLIVISTLLRGCLPDGRSDCRAAKMNG